MVTAISVVRDWCHLGRAFLNHDHQPPLVGVACEVDCSTSSAVTFCCSEHGLPLQIFVNSEFLASSWKYFRGRGILNHTPLLCGTVTWVKKSRGSPLNHENNETLTPRKISAIR